MNIKKTIISVVAFFSFLILCAVSLYGVILPENTPVTSVGGMQLATFKNGLSLFQGNRGYYYSVSPFNDYEIVDGNSRSSLIWQDEVEHNTYTTDFNKSYFSHIIESLQGYFGWTTPTISFANTKQINYTSDVNKNIATITTTVQTPDDAHILGITFSYTGKDFVYDKTGKLYNFKDELEIQNFKKIYGISLNMSSSENLRPAILTKSIIIVNPYLSSVMLIRANKDQKMYINRNAKLIEIEKLVQKNNYTNTVTIEVYPDPNEAQQHL